MERVKEHFCWFKVVSDQEAPAEGKGIVSVPAPPPGKDVPEGEIQANGEVGLTEKLRTEAAKAAKVASAADPAVTSAPRPPAKAAIFGQYPSSPGAGITSAPRPPRFYGGAVFAGWWGVDGVYDGTRGGGSVYVDMHPVVGTRSDAIQWLNETPEGLAWQQGALTTFLACFTASGDW